jgi:hypothetical protein
MEGLEARRQHRVADAVHGRHGIRSLDLCRELRDEPAGLEVVLAQREREVAVVPPHHHRGGPVVPDEPYDLGVVEGIGELVRSSSIT